jgi:beta-aspartyl-peptidase (threonine type)
MSSIVVHGGAYAIPDDQLDAKFKGCRLAVETGHKILESNGTALDAVEAAVKVLEDDNAFNAGHGSVLTLLGTIEMDAMIMDGATLNIGSVAAVKSISNPILLARKVMEKTNHTMLVGEGADAFARQQGFPQVSAEEMVSPESLSRWENHSKYNKVVENVFNKAEHDTVGAVARDKYGNIACATSTGGITHKMPGRVGDSPIIGCGGYCDNSIGGISTTGHGEAITRVTLANRVLNLSLSMPAADAVTEALRYMQTKTNGGKGGLIMITPSGDIVKGFTTERMAWASIDINGLFESGINEPYISI